MENYTPPIEELLAGYALQDLSPEEERIVEQYLAAHPEQQQEVQRLQMTLSLLPFSLPENTASPQLRDRLLKQRFVLPKRRIVTWGVMLITIAIASLGWDSYHLRQQVAELQALERTTALLEMPDNRLLSFKALDASFSSSSTGSLVMTPNHKKGILAIQNLDRLPAGKVYSLWLISMSGEKVYCQHFVPNKEGKVHLQIPIAIGMAEIQEAVITIEAETQPQLPLGPMILKATYVL